ncbi:MAG TPA: sulfatase [Planctomycetota bacterium]|nr:sulfatase [Planctomycetota bacterium]
MHVPLSPTLALALGLALVPGSGTPRESERPAAPNVVVVFTDDQGWGDIGVQGARGFATPHLDRLAAEGVRLTDFYAAQPVCSASRAALLTGCYPNRIGISGALAPFDRVGLAASETTLGELFGGQGYATAHFGKWHLGHLEPFNPTRHGFDEYFGVPYSHDMWPAGPRPWGDLPTLEGEEVVELNQDPARWTVELTARAVDFVERCAAEERPFFVYLAHPLPHVPLAASEAWRGHSEAGLYGDVIEEIDASVGTLLESLVRLGIDERTLLVFSSDNGPWLSYGDHAGSTGGLREGKGTTFEGGVRVPFLARWPGVLPAGRVCAEPAMAIDVLPTLARLLGAPASAPERPIDGRDIWPLLVGEPGARTPHEALYFYNQRNDLEALRCGRWKLHLPHGYRTMQGRESGAGGSAAPYDHSARIGLALFDLEADPGETVDLTAREPAVVRALLELVEVMRGDLGDDLTGREARGARPPGLAESPNSDER